MSALIDLEGTAVRFYATHLQHNRALERSAHVKAIVDVSEKNQKPASLARDFHARRHQQELKPLMERLADG